tara:strand:+ start:584 stop:1171 length:588 start_codon:yes stop_codon:yes gene_type:complete
MSFLRLIVASSLTLVCSSSLASEDVTPYDTVAGWKIVTDNTLNGGCFVLAEYKGGTILRVGIDNSDPESKSVYAIFGDPEWKSIEYGKEYEVQIQFGNEEKWSGEAEGMSFDPPENQSMLWIEINNQDDAAVLFFEEFMQESTVELFYNESSIALLKLKDSYAAGLKLAECQKAADNANKDPFSQPTDSNDPFSA